MRSEAGSGLPGEKLLEVHVDDLNLALGNLVQDVAYEEASYF